jgi:hypothetical protein
VLVAFVFLVPLFPALFSTSFVPLCARLTWRFCSAVDQATTGAEHRRNDGNTIDDGLTHAWERCNGNAIVLSRGAIHSAQLFRDAALL